MDNEVVEEPSRLQAQWKLFEERQKAKRQVQVSQLDFGRPTSALSLRQSDYFGGQTSVRPQSAKTASSSTTMTLTRDEEKIEEPERLSIEKMENSSSDSKSSSDEEVEDVILVNEENVFVRKSDEPAGDTPIFVGDIERRQRKRESRLETDVKRRIEVEREKRGEKETEREFTPLTKYTEEDWEVDLEREINCVSDCDDDDDGEKIGTRNRRDGREEESECEDPNDEGCHEWREYLQLFRKDVEAFMLRSAPSQLKSAVRCRLHRKGSFFELVFEGGEVRMSMTAKKKKSATATYEISVEAGDGTTREIAGVKANILGTNFTVYRKKNEKEAANGPSGIDAELAVVTYRPNVLGLKGPRRIGVVVPGMTSDGKRVVLKPKAEGDSIVNRLKTEATTNLIQMWNKSPQWNEDTQSFVLNFHGRVTQASIKNFQVVHERDPDYVILQFGRVDTDHFTLDFRYPLCAVQAMGVALTSFDRKLACE